MNMSTAQHKRLNGYMHQHQPPRHMRFTPLRWQWEAMQLVRNHRTTYARCGLGAGKTLFGAAYVAEMSTRYAGSTGLVIAPTYRMLSDATLHTFKQRFQPFIREHAKSAKTTTTVNGTTILWRSGSDPDSLRGPNIKWAWIDEVAITSQETYEQVLSRLREGSETKLLLTSTPNAIRGKWLRKVMERNRDVAIVTASTRDNYHLPSEYLTGLEAAFTADYARQELHGEDIDITSPTFSLSWIHHGPQWTREDGWTISIGVDLATSTSDAADFRANAVTAHHAATGKYKLIDLTHGRWTFHDHLKEIHRLISKWNPDNVGVEDVAYQHAMIQELRRTTTTNIVSYKPGTRDKLTRFQPWAAKYEQGLVEHCGKMPEELELELEVFPSRSHHDDLIDALVISLSTHEQRKASVLFL